MSSKLARAGDLGVRHPAFRTRPVAPSTSIVSPSLIQSIAPFRPTTQGMPSSRATIAECDSRLPRSTTMAEALAEQRDPAGIGVARDQDLALLRALCVRGSRTTRATARDDARRCSRCRCRSRAVSVPGCRRRRCVPRPAIAAPRDGQPLGRIGPCCGLPPSRPCAAARARGGRGSTAKPSIAPSTS